MAKLKIRGKDLEKLGYPRGSKVASLAINVMMRHYKKNNKGFVLSLLENIAKTPEHYESDVILGQIAREFIEPEEIEIEMLNEGAEIPLKHPTQIADYKTYGGKNIAQTAKQQMNIAMRLPVVQAGALMADAHAGYGLPIGGVLAVDNAVIPYGVGMDIGCRMYLSIYDIPAEYIRHNRHQLTLDLKANTRFGNRDFDKTNPPEILDRQEFREISTVKKLKDKAYRQFGSSGSGNHFVEFGIVEITEPENDLGLAPKSYLALLSQSGSRGFGATIAQTYTRIAKERCRLPREAQHLAWLGLDTEAGMEYWLAMNLAGDYASACHHEIHRKLSLALGDEPIARVENHHNFAWKETLADGKEVIVHRKGATPASKGELGVIPGSMTAPGFIVRGKGSPMSLNSASHGAGRQMSRTKAKASFSGKNMKEALRKSGVKLIGGGIDEIPMAYKDIHQVMAAQTDLVDVLGTFQPKIVRMDR